MLGIPTVLDRLIQQAVHQELGPLFETGFSANSYGFHPGKSAVDRPWKRIFLGYDMTFHRTPKLKVGKKALDRIKSKILEISRKGRERNLKRVTEEITPILRGWSNYFKLSEVTTVR